MNAISSSLARRLPSLVSYAIALCLSFNLVVPCTRAQQQPAPQPTPPQRTGRSYDGGVPAKAPPPPAPQAPSPVTFTDATTAARIDFKHAASVTSRKYLLESMGAGVALLDYDNDGRLDIYFTNGARLEDPMPAADARPDKRDARFWNRLYRQRADSTFEDTTERAGVRGFGYDMGAAAGDFDSDGYADLYVTAYGANILYRNRRDGTFEDVTRKLNVAGGGWSTSAGWLDYNNDGRLDLFVARYMDWDFARGDLYCGEMRPGFRAYCHPDNFKGAANILYRQRTDGTFEDVTTAAKLADPQGKGLGVAFADFDGDGLTDIIVANDSVRQSLYHNRGDGTFEDVALLAGVGYDENGKTFAGMGVDAADFDNDGRPDIFITALSNETYPLYHNTGEMSFNYVTQTSGVGRITQLYSGWGTRFLDADNDGWRDIFVAQGHVLDTIEKTTSYLKYKQTPLLMRGVPSAGAVKLHTFANVSATAGALFNQPYAARGAAFGDLDNDGDTDIVMAVTDGAPVLLRNDGTKSHWLGITLAGTRSHRAGTGARVVVTDATGRRQIFDANNSGSYLSSSDPRILVGLGAATGVSAIEVRWPSGQKQTVTKPEIDRYIVIKEP
ncbi:MAG TPA: CRTAC1 family protein [Pyrinomonadaceae bacterium]|nr:CRTAC1 family protein [Pyrinomonadaceae bacterium]